MKSLERRIHFGYTSRAAPESELCVSSNANSDVSSSEIADKSLPLIHDAYKVTYFSFCYSSTRCLCLLFCFFIVYALFLVSSSIAYSILRNSLALEN